MLIITIYSYVTKKNKVAIHFVFVEYFSALLLFVISIDYRALISKEDFTLVCKGKLKSEKRLKVEPPTPPPPHFHRFHRKALRLQLFLLIPLYNFVGPEKSTFQLKRHLFSIHTMPLNPHSN